MPANSTFCVYITNTLIQNVSSLVAQYYTAIPLMVNSNSGLRYSPFNKWQFWEIALYNPNLLGYLKNSSFAATDPFFFNCTYQSFSITGPSVFYGGIGANITFNCSLFATSSSSGKTMNISSITFTQNLTLNFTGLNQQFINGQIWNSTLLSYTGSFGFIGNQEKNWIYGMLNPFGQWMTENIYLFGAVNGNPSSRGISFPFMQGRFFSTFTQDTYGNYGFCS